MIGTLQIGETDIYEEFGCILAHVDIGAPSVKTKYVPIPLRNGDLDLTEVLGDVKYDNRIIKIRLLYPKDDIDAVYSDIQNFCHGKKEQVTFNTDADYFYYGRIEVKGYNKKRTGGGTIELEVTADPFKYATVSSLEDWLWDPFDFEEGYINELGNIDINGTVDVLVIGDYKLSYPTIISDAVMQVTCRNVTVAIPVGTTKLYDIELLHGDNHLIIVGNGTVSIDYRGERL